MATFMNTDLALSGAELLVWLEAHPLRLRHEHTHLGDD